MSQAPGDTSPQPAHETPDTSRSQGNSRCEAKYHASWSTTVLAFEVKGGRVALFARNITRVGGLEMAGCVGRLAANVPNYAGNETFRKKLWVALPRT
jgi:hypothetical protein